MMLNFWKLHGAGNDFVVLDAWNDIPVLSSSFIAWMCDRHLGIGADGLICIQPDAKADFRMVYYNADGFEGSMCGNGGRTAAAFAFMRLHAGQQGSFMAYDGLHHYIIHNQQDGLFDVEITMKDVREYKLFDDHLEVNTGSPHYVMFTDNLAELDVVSKGREIRQAPAFGPKGINVNFVETKPDQTFVRTYERGVEDETLSCGTGVTAVGIALALKSGQTEHTIHARGGTLYISLMNNAEGFTNIRLRGPVQWVFEGRLAHLPKEIAPYGLKS